MTPDNELAPRAESSLSKWSAVLARRALSEMTLAQGPALVVTGTCEMALEFARLEGESCLTTIDLEEAWARIAEGDLGLVVVGTDVKDWPPAEVRALAAYRTPLIRCQERVGDVFVGRGICLGPGGWLAAADGRDAYSTRSEVEFDHAALLKRARRLGAWFRSPDAREIATARGREVVVRGGRFQVLATDLADLLTTFGEQWPLGQILGGDVEDARDRIRCGDVDGLLLHSCAWPMSTHSPVSEVLGQAAERGLPVICICGCRGVASRAGMQGVASVLPAPFAIAELDQSLSYALLERKAWLFDHGRSSDHLIVTLKEEPYSWSLDSAHS